MDVLLNSSANERFMTRAHPACFLCVSPCLPVARRLLHSSLAR